MRHIRAFAARVAATVGTDTAEIYAIAPEQLRKIIDAGKWLELSRSPAKNNTAMADIIRQHGGAVFGTGGDGDWDVRIPDGVTEQGRFPYPHERSGATQRTAAIINDVRKVENAIGKELIGAQFDDDVLSVGSGVADLQFWDGETPRGELAPDGKPGDAQVAVHVFLDESDPRYPTGSVRKPQAWPPAPPKQEI
jgi:hypothetical protein